MLALRRAGDPVTETELVEALPALLRELWGLRDVVVGPSIGPVGMGSVTAVVDRSDGPPLVAKWVPSWSGDALDRGSAIAREVEEAGVPAGAPLLTTTGALSTGWGGGRVALLRRVDGEPLVGATAADQERMAAVLAQVHAVRQPALRAAPFLADTVADVRDVEGWVVPAVAAVLREHAVLPPLTWGLVHHDPAPEAFLHDPTSGRTGLIDWTGATEGPVLFDLASALMYLGGLAKGRMFWEAYVRGVPERLARELSTHLPALQRFRGAVQAAYFSRRVAAVDLTGIATQDDNLAGLHDARRMLAAAGVHEAGTGPGGTSVLRPMTAGDLDEVVRVQEEGSVVALGHLFRQDTHPFPRDAIRARWQAELDDAGVECFVVQGAVGEVLGFVALRGPEVLHFGTARATWGSGLARRAHDEALDRLVAPGHERARLWVFEANAHARRFYEHRGWSATGERTRSSFAPNPVLLAYERRLPQGLGPSLHRSGNF